MTDLADLPFNDPDWPPQPAVEREPRKCRRHRWVGYIERTAGQPDAMHYQCVRCNQVRDAVVSKRGKTARNRGNGYEREVAAKLGGRRVGQYGDKVDVEVPGWLRVQCKNGGAYPALLDRWLRAIPVQADLLRAVVVGDAPGPGHQRRSLIVLDLEEFASWYAKGGL